MTKKGLKIIHFALNVTKNGPMRKCHQKSKAGTMTFLSLASLTFFEHHQKLLFSADARRASPYSWPWFGITSE